MASKLPVVVSSALVFSMMALIAGGAIGGTLIYAAATAGPSPPSCLKLAGPSGDVNITLSSSSHANGTGSLVNESSPSRPNSRCFTFTSNVSGSDQFASSNGAYVNVSILFGPYDLACSSAPASCSSACPQYAVLAASDTGPRGGDSFETFRGLLGGGCEAYLLTATDPGDPWELTAAPSVTVTLSWNPP
jgi:hypothetical protein